MKGLSLQGVCKRFGGVTAADEITLDVPPGRVTGLIGPNGAGKTTIVNLITGMLALSAGSDRVRRPRHQHLRPTGSAGSALPGPSRTSGC